MNLQQLITDYPEEFLSKHARQTFNELPYLLKILDVKDMLSIQVHPSKEAAAIGFQNEEAAGILIGALHRNYKDKNHKPEVMVALSEFWLLHGFLVKDKLKAVLRSVPEFADLIPVFGEGDYKALYHHVMNMMQDEVNTKLMPLVAREIGKGEKRRNAKRANPDGG